LNGANALKSRQVCTSEGDHVCRDRARDICAGKFAWCQSIPGKALRAADAARASGIPATGFTKGNHPRFKSVIRREAYLGSTIADHVAKFGGSWTFIAIFAAALAIWVTVNLIAASHAFDPYPFIFLNLILSMLAAVQAPVIMMSQNRHAAKDRVDATLTTSLTSYEALRSKLWSHSNKSKSLC